MMQAMMGKTNHLMIPELYAKVWVYCPAPEMEINVALVKDFVMQYDLHIKVATGENQVESFHQAFCKWYLKLCKANPQVIIYPWASKVQMTKGS